MDETPRPSPPPRLFQLTLRDLLWVMVVVALAAGWYVDRRSTVAPAAATSAAAAPGRYLVQPLGATGQRLLLVDTQTGTCWEQSPSTGRWVIQAGSAPNLDKK
jgi:hypothetical protein